MRKKLILLFSVMLVVSTLLIGCSSEPTSESGNNNAEGKSITLNAVSFLPIDHPLTASLEEWISKVNESTDGRVTVNWKGGADVMPISEQFQALKSGVIDVNFTYIGQYQSVMPESLSVALSQIQPWEERENGFYDFLVDRHEQVDVQYLGRWLTGSPRLWLNEPVESVEDLQNLKIRSAPNYNRFFDNLGISSVMIDPSEVYTALQTGVAEGFVFGGMMGPRNDGWTDSAKYVLDHPFWTQNCTILMNTDKWAEISPEDQEAIINATAEYERYMVDYYTSLNEEEKQQLIEEGVEFIQFDETEAQKFLDIAYDSEWNYLEEHTPELIEEMKKLTTK